MKWLPRVVVLSLGCAAVAVAQPPELSSRPSSQGVASENATVSRDASSVLRAGGSAADAAIAAALVGGVTAPTSSGLGGGGFVLVWDAARRAPFLLDFRETAPAALDATVFEQRPLPQEKVGHLVGVPGEARGLFELHKRAGKLPWAQLVRFAEQRARLGYIVSPHLAAMISGSRSPVASVPALAALFTIGGKPAAVGMRTCRWPTHSRGWVRRGRRFCTRAPLPKNSWPSLGLTVARSPWPISATTKLWNASPCTHGSRATTCSRCHYRLLAE